MAEMNVQGMSTRKVKANTKLLYAVEVSIAQIIRAAGELGEVFQIWHKRPLDEIIYLFVDARRDDS